jgi:hypothetical protein
MKKHYRHENDCLNCGAALQGKYCHVCGQENLEIKETFGHMMNHAISDYFHFDHQFFHTLKPLLFKPGYLTNEYMAGRRAQYLHPVKMYIFISLVYFLLVFQQKSGPVQINQPPGSLKEIAKAADQINHTPYLSAQAKKKSINELYLDGGYKMENNHWVIDTSRKARQRAEENKHVVNPSTSDTTYEEYMANQQKLPEAKRDGWFERYYNQKAFAINKQKIDLVETIEDSLKHNFPKMMFLLLPLFALILMVTFYRSKKFYVEHLIYAFHLHCFIFLFLSIILLVEFIVPATWKTFNGWLAFAAVIAILWYVYKSLRVVYHRSRWRTIFKMIGMYLMYFLSFLVCISLLVMITIFTAA